MVLAELSLPLLLTLLWNNGMRRAFEPEITEQIHIHEVFLEEEACVFYEAEVEER